MSSLRERIPIFSRDDIILFVEDIYVVSELERRTFSKVLLTEQAKARAIEMGGHAYWNRLNDLLVKAVTPSSGDRPPNNLIEVIE